VTGTYIFARRRYVGDQPPFGRQSVTLPSRARGLLLGSGLYRAGYGSIH
jgi:hypothetical protein